MSDAPPFGEPRHAGGTPKNDAARGGSRDRARVGTVHGKHIRIDYTAAFVLTGMARFASVRERVRGLGPSLFDGGAELTVARYLITGEVIEPPGAGPLFRAEVHRLLDVVTLDSVVTDEAFALRKVEDLANRRHRRLAVAQLRWAADRVEAGDPLDYLRGCTDRAFAVALADRPLDPGMGWSEVAA